MALITKIKTVYSEVVAALGFTPENSANRAQPNGYAGLDSGGKVPAAQLPLASASTTGALSSANWTTFNSKQAALTGSGIVKSTNGTISYLTDNSANWGTAYNRSLTSATVTGTTTKTLTLNKQDGTTLTASWSDLNTNAVTSVFGRTGAVVATEGDYSLTKLSDVNLASPANGQLLQNNGTQWVNWTPNYLTANQVVTLSGDVTGTGATAITATLANTTVTAGTYGNATQAPQITVDSKGRATSAGNVTITPAWSSVTGTPTTILGYGITDGVTLTGAQTLTNKTVTDATFTIQDDADNTKKAQFQASGITTATTRTYTLPNVNGTLVTTGDTGSVTNTMLAGSIADTKLSTIATAGKVSNSATTATSANTASAIVARDASGNFTAGNITASLIGNANTATTLQTARNINGVSFNGSANITIKASTTNNLTISSPLSGGSFDGGSAISIGLSNSGVVAGTYGNSTQAGQFTVGNNGLISSAANVTITPAWSSITSTPTTVLGYGITDGVTLTGTQTLTNKTVTDATFTIQDDADNTKKAQFQASGITTATTRTYTLPNDDGKIVITNSGNIENTLPKFNNDDKLVASNISDNGILVNIGPYAVFNTGGISVISYISTHNVEILGATLGNFGETNFYGAVSAPTLYSNDAISQSTVIVNPKIPYCVNGTNGYIGIYSGASIQFASDTTAVNFWGLGVGTNSVGTDTFSIGRNNTQFFTINNSGAITTQIVSTRANNTGTGLGQIYLNGATGNRIDFNTNGVGAPTFTTRSVGAKIVLYPGVSATASDYALGIASGTLWYSVPLTTDQHQFYAGTTSIARIRSQGIQTRGHIYQGNTAFSAQNAGTTLTISQILTSVIESTPTANITFTLPTGTNTDAGVMSSLETFASFTWSVVNTSTGFTITMAGNTGNTYIGNTTIAANTSATFRTQKTAANTFKTVRI